MTVRGNATTTVLLIENKPVARMDMTAVLSEAGFSVIEAHSLLEAWTTLETRREVRVLLADLDALNGADGLEFARRVHDRWPSIGLVITSDFIRHLRPNGVPGDGCFLPRPIPADTLLHEVNFAAQRIAA